VGGADQRQQRRRRRLVGVAPAGDDDGVGALEQLGRVRRLQRDAAERADRPRLGRADGEVVPLDAQLRALEREQFDHAAELEGAEAVVGQRDDEVFAHGAILTQIGGRATAGAAPRRR
jgi:hypothetical protein